MNSYLESMKKACLAGHYIPELESCWFRETNFQVPKFFAYMLH